MSYVVEMIESKTGRSIMTKKDETAAGALRKLNAAISLFGAGRVYNKQGQEIGPAELARLARAAADCSRPSHGKLYVSLT